MSKKVFIYIFVFLFLISCVAAENITSCYNCTLYNATVVNEDNSYQGASVIGLLGLIVFFLAGAWLLDCEHTILRLILIFMAFITLPVLGNHVMNVTEGTQLASVGLSFFKITQYTLRLFIIYVGLYFAYKVFDHFGWLAKITQGRLGSK